MKRCGDCKNFLPNSSDMGADEGYCTAILDEEEIGKVVNIYDDATECHAFDFVEASRVRTDHSEFMYDPLLRPQREFDEK